MLILGHRGAPGYPRRNENTLSSFWKALWSGAVGFELDVRCTKDGQLVCIHDATLERVTDGMCKNAVRSLTYAELSEAMADINGPEHRYTVPLLLEVFDVFGERCFINIELKEHDGADSLLQFLKPRSRHAHGLLISCFSALLEKTKEKNAPSWANLEKIAEYAPVALLASKNAVTTLGAKKYTAFASDMGALAIHPQYQAIDSELMYEAKQKGLLVNALTVNDGRIAKLLRVSGVNGIITDVPELM